MKGLLTILLALMRLSAAVSVTAEGNPQRMQNGKNPHTEDMQPPDGFGRGQTWLLWMIMVTPFPKKARLSSGRFIAAKGVIK